MIPVSRAGATSHAAFSMNHPARRNATGIESVLNCRSMNEDAFRVFERGRQGADIGELGLRNFAAALRPRGALRVVAHYGADR